jgi:hypothetical protein
MDLSPRLAGLLADAVAAFHFVFVLFVALGGLLVARWRRLAWAHLPAAAWGALIEFAGWICPLTPLENELRRQAGEAAYGGGFIERYLLPVLYPQGLTRGVQLALGLGVLLLNGAIYGWLVLHPRRRAG